MKKKFIYMEITHHSNDNLCDYKIYKDDFGYHKSNLDNLVCEGTFEKEKGGLFGTPMVETIHNHGYKGIIDIMFYGSSNNSITYQISLKQ